MSYNDRYWVDKSYRASLAKEHTFKMDAKYKDEIKYSKNKTISYGMNNNCRKPVGSLLNRVIPEIILEDCDSVAAVFKYAEQGRVCVLNFASYLNPGGRFMDGSKAQEECLCHASFLYNVLRSQLEYYRWNKYNRNNTDKRALYMDRALYSPKIKFFMGDKQVDVDVLTCAAPNLTAYGKYMHDRFGGLKFPELEQTIQEDNEKALRDRMQFIKDVAEDNGVNTLILGAFGCGVFGQDANLVAQIWKELFKISSVRLVVYAVPSEIDKDNYEIFKKVFEVV